MVFGMSGQGQPLRRAALGLSLLGLTVLAGCQTSGGTREGASSLLPGIPVLGSFKLDSCKLGSTCVAVILPPRLVEAGGLKKVAVVAGSGQGARDLTQLLEGKMSAVTVDDKPYYTIVAATDRTRQATFEISTQALQVQESRQMENRPVCSGSKKKDCPIQPVPCVTKTATLGASIRLRGPNGAEIAVRNASGETKSTHCTGDIGGIATNAALLGQASEAVLVKLQDELAVRSEPRRINIMDADTGITDPARKQRFAEAVAFAKGARMDRACPMFGELSEVETNSVSIFFNLGFCEQVNGDWRRAHAMFSQADRLTNKPVDQLKAALEETRPYTIRR
jgi:hypothetical protein